MKQLNTFVLLFLFTSFCNYSQTNDPNFENAEITVQVETPNYSNHQFKFELIPQSELWNWVEIENKVIISNYQEPSEQIINGEYLFRKHFFQIRHSQDDNSTIVEDSLIFAPFWLGLYKLKVSVYEEDNWNELISVLIDYRDARFPGDPLQLNTCNETLGNDITIKLYYQYDSLYPITKIYYARNSVDINSENVTWNELSKNQLYNFYSFWGCNDVVSLDYPKIPSIPQNFITHNETNQHPVLSWDSNQELDIQKYEIFSSSNGIGYSKIGEVAEDINQFVDYGVIIANLKFDSQIYYKIKTVDVFDFSSEFTNAKYVLSSHLNKNLSEYIDSKILTLGKITFQITNIGRINNMKFDANQYEIASAGGLVLTGFTNQVLWGNTFSNTYYNFNQFLPGAVGSNPEAEENKLYLIYKEDVPFGESWIDWENAVELGADFYDGNDDGLYTPIDINNNGRWDENEDKPGLIGDFTLFSVANDGDTIHSYIPNGIEIAQTIFSSNIQDYENLFFIKYNISNNGINRLDSVYLGNIVDFDLGFYEDDLGGTDTLLNAVYGYNDSVDYFLGESTPAILVQIVEGPHEFIPNQSFIDQNGNGIFDEDEIALDTAKYFEYNNKFKKIVGASNVGLTASTIHDKYFQMGTPDTYEQLLNYMKGGNTLYNQIDVCDFDYGNGEQLSNCSEVNSKFMYSGNPITSEGWLNVLPKDNRFLSSIGKLSFDINEQKQIILAYIVDKKNTNHESILSVKQKAADCKELYNSGFDNFLTSASPNENIVTNFKLYQNYPNPFSAKSANGGGTGNPSTQIKFGIPQDSQVKLELFNTLGEKVATLVNKEMSAGIHNYQLSISNYKLTSGIYFYRLQSCDFVETKKMILLK